MDKFRAEHIAGPHLGFDDFPQCNPTTDKPSRSVFDDVDDTIVHLCKGIQSTAAGTQGVSELTNALAALITARANAKTSF